MMGRLMRGGAFRAPCLATAMCLLAACGGSALNGAVGGLQLTVEDGFYTEFEWDGLNYYAIVLTNIPDACNVFNAAELDLGSEFGIFQVWLSALDIQDYPVYSVDHLDEAEAAFAVSWFTVHINSTEVVNTDGVAGVVKVSGFDFEDKVLTGSMDVIYSGNGNRLQGGFSVEYCAVDWEDAAEQLIGGAG